MFHPDKTVGRNVRVCHCNIFYNSAVGPEPTTCADAEMSAPGGRADQERRRSQLLLVTRSRRSLARVD
jgi:hypothetical protein